MTDQASSGNGQHQRWAESSKQQAANGGSGCWQQGGQQGGGIACEWEVLFVGLLGCLPLADGICDDVLDVVEGVASETVVELTQEEKKNYRRIGFRQENVYIRKN
jgi:hypothetical protein